MITKARAKQLRGLIEKAAKSLLDTDALACVTLFPAWKTGITVTAGERYAHKGKLYKAVQGHTTQDGWEPDKTPALWTEVAKPSEIPVWKQPTGAQDAYNTGDKVHYPDGDGPVYVSRIDSNTWAPGVYGWEEET